MAKSDSTGIVMLAVAGAAAYYAYSQGWFCSMLGVGCSTVPVPASVLPVSVASVTVPVPVVVPSPVASGSPNAVAALTSYVKSAGYDPTAQYDAFQWDYFAARALGSNYVTLSKLPSLVGANLYSMAQYLAAYPAGLGAFVHKGPRKTVIFFPKRQVAVVLPHNYHMKAAG
jgi:hypothetical protein